MRNPEPHAEARNALDAIAAGSTAHELESQTLDFKEPSSRDDTVRDVVEAVLCFANAIGGVVVLGVANKTAGPTAFVGVDLQTDYVRKRIYDLTQPHLVVDISERVMEGQRVMVIRVPESSEIHSDMKGRAPQRIGTDCLPMSPQDQARLREERHGIDWSSQSSGRLLREASSTAVEAAKSLLERLPDQRRELASLNRRDLLRALGVVSGSHLSRAGEILFCISTGSTPRIVYQYRTTPAGEPTAIERLTAPLIVDFERVLELIAARRHLTPITLPDGQQLHIQDFPDLAVREAIANAVLHRDYYLSEPVTIDHSPEVFIVASPGPLVSGVTPQNILTHPSKPRNRALAQAARTLGLAEEVGRGVDRMYREMIGAGRDVPSIDSESDHVRVSLVGGAPNTQIARYVALLPQRERDDTDAMLTLFSLVSHKTTNAQALSPILQKPPDEVEAVLRRLASETAAMLEPTRESARRSNPNYRLRAGALQKLGSAVRYQRRTTDEIDRKIIEHVSEYEKVTNRTVRNFFDVSTQRAAAILSNLVEREILVKTSDAQRGPTVEYGPGRQFPSKSPKPRARSGAQLTLDSDAGSPA
jgi:ATP-dependent DNA helicase RecG